MTSWKKYISVSTRITYYETYFVLPRYLQIFHLYFKGTPNTPTSLVVCQLLYFCGKNGGECETEGHNRGRVAGILNFFMFLALERVVNKFFKTYVCFLERKRKNQAMRILSITVMKTVAEVEAVVSSKICLKQKSEKVCSSFWYRLFSTFSPVSMYFSFTIKMSGI